MEAITPYLNFNGNAAEALAFYVEVLNGEIVHQQKFGEGQKDFPVPESHFDKILHALFKAGDLSFMASDCPPNVQVSYGDGVSLALNFTNEEDIVKTYDAMSDGGVITMPLQDTFWGARFGMVKDKFGIHWMFNYDKPKA